MFVEGATRARALPRMAGVAVAMRRGRTLRVEQRGRSAPRLRATARLRNHPDGAPRDVLPCSQRKCLPLLRYPFRQAWATAGARTIITRPGTPITVAPGGT